MRFHDIGNVKLLAAWGLEVMRPVFQHCEKELSSLVDLLDLLRVSTKGMNEIQSILVTIEVENEHHRNSGKFVKRGEYRDFIRLGFGRG